MNLDCQVNKCLMASQTEDLICTNQVHIRVNFSTLFLMPDFTLEKVNSFRNRLEI